MRHFVFDNDEEPVLFNVRIERTPCLPMVAHGATVGQYDFSG